MGISIKGKGGGARVTINGEPVTEKLNLIEKEGTSEIYEPFAQEFNEVIVLNENELIFIEPGGYQNVYKFDKRTKLLTLLGNLNERSNPSYSRMQPFIIDNMLYYWHGVFDIEKKNAITLNTTAKAVFFNKNKIYFVKIYPREIYKTEKGNLNNRTLINSNATDGPESEIFSIWEKEGKTYLFNDTEYYYIFENDNMTRKRSSIKFCPYTNATRPYEENGKIELFATENPEDQNSNCKVLNMKKYLFDGEIFTLVDTKFRETSRIAINWNSKRLETIVRYYFDYDATFLETKEKIYAKGENI